MNGQDGGIIWPGSTRDDAAVTATRTAVADAATPNP
jgi:hypothetical protein